jgi:hypothetical protein
MRKASVVALVSCLTLGTAAFAAQAAKPATATATKTATTTTTTKTMVTKPGHAHGAVSAVDATANTLTLKDTFNVGATTKITEKGKTITLAEVKVGDSASVWYTKDGDKMNASKIIVSPKK